MGRTPDREAHTDSMLVWQEACQFLGAACEIPNYRTPRLHLAAHGIELALKSHLRANGYTLEQLRQVGHSLAKCLDHCKALGMAAPSDDDLHRLFFLSEAHVDHEWRYAHTDRPPHMEWADWIIVAEWALRAAIPAVARDSADDSSKVPKFEWRMGVQVADALDPKARG
jgi:hypothetical protein